MTGFAAVLGADFAGVEGLAGVVDAGAATVAVDVESPGALVVTGAAVAGADAGGAVTGLVDEFCVVGGACADVRGLASSNNAVAVATGTLARKTRMRKLTPERTKDCFGMVAPQLPVDLNNFGATLIFSRLIAVKMSLGYQYRHCSSSLNH